MVASNKSIDDIIMNTLVSLHIQNLNHCLKYAMPNANKTEIIPSDGDTLEEGQENGKYEGMLIVRNGDHIVREYQESGLIEDNIIPDPKRFYDEQTLLDYFNKVKEGRPMQEGASYLINGTQKLIYEIETFGTHASKLTGDERFKDYIPPNFIAKFKYIDPDLPNRMGMKTKAAIKLATHPPAGLNIKAYQIKRSKRGNTIMGRITQFGPEGLERTIEFEYNAELEKHNSLDTSTIEVTDERFKNTIRLIDIRYEHGNEIVTDYEFPQRYESKSNSEVQMGHHSNSDSISPLQFT